LIQGRIELLRDTQGLVWFQANRALEEITGQKFGEEAKWQKISG
jgi:hypothetical protein